ncbi:MAG: hypothetical protein ACRD0X_02035 [Thermoanaerobaculia bacterium]
MPARPAGVLDPETERRFEEGVRFTGEFHMGESNVHQALAQLAQRLASLDIPYAIVGALALNAYGVRRATVDVDILLAPEGLRRFKEAALGRGYVERLPGGRGLRDTAHGVDVDIVVTGEYPGDGREKPVAFPDPAECAVRGDSFSLVPLPLLVDLKIASGMTARHRLRDLADVIELIRANDLAREFGDRLSPYVQAKFVELWNAAQEAG